MKLVVDASVIVALLFADRPDEPDGIRAIKLFDAFKDGDVTLVQPVHWLAEVAAVSAMKEPHRAQESIRDLQALDIAIATSQQIYSSAIDIAIRRKAHLFDALYHSVALTCGATLITADQRYFAAARAEGQIKLLHSFTL